MAHKNIIFLLMAAVVMVSVSGCLETNRNVSSQLRWQRTIDKARLEAAQQSLQDGRLMYAQRILKECQRDAQPDSPYSDQVRQMLAQIQTENNRYAKAGEKITSIEEIAY